MVEYEWAPIDRLGLEIELPFSFYYPLANDVQAPNSKLNGLKLAAQYSFLVSETHNVRSELLYLCLNSFSLTLIDTTPWIYC